MKKPPGKSISQGFSVLFAYKEFFSVFFRHWRFSKFFVDRTDLVRGGQDPSRFVLRGGGFQREHVALDGIDDPFVRFSRDPFVGPDRIQGVPDEAFGIVAVFFPPSHDADVVAQGRQYDGLQGIVVGESPGPALLYSFCGDPQQVVAHGGAVVVYLGKSAVKFF